MPERQVTLRSERFERNRYFLSARVDDGGELVIEGQDLGETAGRFWGGSEYEWQITIAAEHVPTFVDALGGSIETDDPLDLLVTRFAEDERYASRQFLAERAIPFTFWSRVGE